MTKLKSNKKPTKPPTKKDPKPHKKIKKQKPNRPLSPNPKKPDPETLQTLLEPYTTPQLITFLIDSALKTPSVYSKIVEKAETDVSHRKIFVHGLSWDASRQTLVSVFEKYGEIEDCSLIIDKNTGKAKGFGFVVFKWRDGAKKALEVGKLRVDDRIVSCQLAYVGPVGNVGGLEGFSGRKIYVSNVGKDVDSGKLREFFERFGEIEAGPLGFDAGTGKCRGYALFVYKNLDGVKRVLEEPNKVFEGVVLNCRMADSGKGGKSVSSITTVMQPLPNVVGQNMGLLGQNPGLNTMLPQQMGQNMGLLGQNPGLNTMLPQQMGYNSIYGGLFGNAGGGVLGTMLGQGLVGANQFGQMGFGSVMMGQGLGSLGVNQSVLGPYSGTSYAPVFPGLLNAYPGTNLG